MEKLAIIGSGLSGLTLATLLKSKFEITVFDKARGVGGRLAARRTGPFTFDHGAQYFTARTEAFRDFIKPLIDLGVIKKWTARHVEVDGAQIVKRSYWESEEPRYVGVPNMNSIAKQMAQNINVKTNIKIDSILRKDYWQLEDEHGGIHKDFDWVISTAPAPQTLQILPKNFVHHALIKRIEMRGCYSLMLGFSEIFPLEFEDAHVLNSDVSWIAVNSHKPQRGSLHTMVIHSSAEYAEKNMDIDRNIVINHLCQETSSIIQHDATQAIRQVLHGWRYANNAKRDIYKPFIDHDLKIAACGDWCLGGRVEGAFTSAQNLAHALETG